MKKRIEKVTRRHLHPTLFKPSVSLPAWSVFLCCVFLLASCGAHAPFQKDAVSQTPIESNVLLNLPIFWTCNPGMGAGTELRPFQKGLYLLGSIIHPKIENSVRLAHPNDTDSENSLTVAVIPYAKPAVRGESPEFFLIQDVSIKQGGSAELRGYSINCEPLPPVQQINWYPSIVLIFETNENRDQARLRLRDLAKANKGIIHCYHKVNDFVFEYSHVKKKLTFPRDMENFNGSNMKNLLTFFLNNGWEESFSSMLDMNVEVRIPGDADLDVDVDGVEEEPEAKKPDPFWQEARRIDELGITLNSGDYISPVIGGGLPIYSDAGEENRMEEGALWRGDWGKVRRIDNNFEDKFWIEISEIYRRGASGHAPQRDPRFKDVVYVHYIKGETRIRREFYQPGPDYAWVEEKYIDHLDRIIKKGDSISLISTSAWNFYMEPLETRAGQSIGSVRRGMSLKVSRVEDTNRAEGFWIEVEGLRIGRNVDVEENYREELINKGVAYLYCLRSFDIGINLPSDSIPSAMKKRRAAPPAPTTEEWKAKVKKKSAAPKKEAPFFKKQELEDAISEIIGYYPDLKLKNIRGRRAKRMIDINIELEGDELSISRADARQMLTLIVEEAEKRKNINSIYVFIRKNGRNLIDYEPWVRGKTESIMDLSLIIK